MKLIPKEADICVCVDLDEVFNEGWIRELKSIWRSDTTRCRYIYNWLLDADNNPKVSFYYEKIHSRNNYKWIYPVHEVLECDTKENVITTDKIILNHYPDSTKSRSSYLPLLELSIKENPENDQNLHYLGREYMYHSKCNKARETLIKHLKLKSSTWIDERCASMRFISRCYIELGRFDEAQMWLDKAINEASHLRDPYIEKALLEYKLKNYQAIESLCLKALKIKNHEFTYINEVFSWDYTVYDLLSLSCYHQGKIDEAITWVEKALKLDPNNKRLIDNRKIFIEEYNMP